MYSENIRARIKHHRTKQKLSQEDMADMLNMDVRSYKRIESGEKKIIDVELVFRIAESIKINPSALLSIEHINPDTIEKNDYEKNRFKDNYHQIILDKDKIISDLKEIIFLKNEIIASLSPK